MEGKSVFGEISIISITCSLSSLRNDVQNWTSNSEKWEQKTGTETDLYFGETDFESKSDFIVQVITYFLAFGKSLLLSQMKTGS